MGGNKEKTDADKEKFEQYKRDHPDLYYSTPNITGPAKWGHAATIGAGNKSVFYFKRFMQSYGFRFFVTLGSTYIGVKGFLYTCIYTSLTPYYQQYLKVPLSDVQVYYNIAQGPWSMKGFFGVLSDLLPIMGWRKRWHCVLASVMGTCAWGILAFFPIKADTAMIAAFCFFLANAHVANNDLLVEGQYAELMRKNPFSGADIVSWVWMGYFIGSLAATWTVGPLADEYAVNQDFKYLRYILIISMPIALQNVLPFVFNWLGEVRLPAGERGFQRAQWNSPNKNLYTIALIMGTCAVLNVLANVLLGSKLRKIISAAGSPKLSQFPLLGWSLVIGAFMIFCCFRFLPKVVARANTYFFLSRALYVHISGLDAWYLAKPDCIPDGPQLSQKFVITAMGTVESIFGGLGVVAFQAIMGDWCFRPCFWVTTALQSIGSLWDCFIYLRWNKKIGIPDELSLLLGNAVIREIVSMMDFMPGVVLTSKLCPKGAESTMYAILAGFSNFGRAIGSNLGAIVVPLTGLEINLGSPEDCDDSPLVLLTLIGQGLIPLLSIPLTWWLIPDARLTGTIVDENGNVFPADDDEDVEEPAEYKDASDDMYAGIGGVPQFDQGATYNPYAQYDATQQQQQYYAEPAPNTTPIGMDQGAYGYGQ